METEVLEKQEMNQTFTDLLTRDDVAKKINSYLMNKPLNIGKDEYCYIRLIGNHLEVGRARIILEE
jgi:hypothetical protein